jgi:23S rRNA pseudouridine2605 synthase
MPRRNESGPERRGPGRSGGGKSAGRGRPGSKPSKRSSKDDTRNSSERKPFGNKRNYSSGARDEKPFNKRASDSKRGDGPKSFGKSRKFSDDKSAGRSSRFDKPFKSSRSGESSAPNTFSKKSRFARPDSRPVGDERKSSLKKPYPRKSDADKGERGNNERPYKKPFSSRGFSERSAPGKRRFTEEDEGRPKSRSDSFGKPYKKAYKIKGPDADHHGAQPSGDALPRRKRMNEGTPDGPKSNQIRLNKFIANSGVSSRREADELIKMGLISVNGKIVSELGYKVNPGDEVRYESKVLRAEKPVYVLMNKPKGFITTTEDPQERKTVMHIIGSAVKERIYPIGRLDRNTTGLLLLTNDGDLADKLMHPSFKVKKIYKVELDKPLTKADFQAIVDGVRLEEGKAMVDDLAIVSDDARTVGIELHIGWNRVVRRIFESLGYDVIKLDRTMYAGLDKKELARGQWRFLNKEEVVHLKHFK